MPAHLTRSAQPGPFTELHTHVAISQTLTGLRPSTQPTESSLQREALRSNINQVGLRSKPSNTIVSPLALVSFGYPSWSDILQVCLLQLVHESHALQFFKDYYIRSLEIHKGNLAAFSVPVLRHGDDLCKRILQSLRERFVTLTCIS